MTSLTDICLALHDARGHADDLRYVLLAARRRGISLPATEAKLAITERRIERLDDTRRATWAAVDKLAGIIDDKARAGLGHDSEEQRLLYLLGCEELDGDRWPYVAAALRAREEPSVESITTFFRARQVLCMRRAA